MKKLFILLFACLATHFATAQEEAIYTHHAFNPVLVNPAAAGFDDGFHNLFLNFRNAFSGFPGAPKTYALSYNGPVLKQLGLGAMLYSENIAATTRYRAQLNYAFRYQVQDLKMSLGFSTELHRMRVSNSVLNNELNDVDDEVLQEHLDGTRAFDASAGLYGSYKDMVFFGLALPNLVRSRTEDSGEETSGAFKSYILQASGKFEVNDSKVKLMPAILLKKVRDTDFQTDVNLIASFLNEQLITGVLFRTGTGNSAGLMLGTKYSALRFIYSYDVYLDDFQKYSGGSHEITVNFEFGSGDGKFDRSKKYRK